jgi:alpha-galactosidase
LKKHKIKKAYISEQNNSKKTNRKCSKLVVIGAGSIFFTRALVIGMCKDAHFKGGTLSLVDINTEMLDVMYRLCCRIVKETSADLTVEAFTDRKSSLKNADFIVISFSNKGVDLRETETKIPAKYGVKQSSGDSIGPGGLFRSIRTVPTLLEIARDIEKICPNAWVFNYTNPTTIMGAALNRYTNLKNLALCDGVILPDTINTLLDRIGIKEKFRQDVIVKIGGINHFSWMTEFRLGKKNLMPELLRSLKENPEKYANKAVEQILEIYGWYSLIGGHMVEFLPYFQGRGYKPEESYVSYIFEIDERRKWMKSFNEEIRRQADGIESVEKLISTTKPDLVIYIADSIIDNAGDTHFVNFPNHGNITNLPDNVVIELPAKIYKNHFKGEIFGEMPSVLRSWILRIIDVQELTLEAAMTGSRRVLRQALIADPLICSFEEAEHIIDDLIQTEREDLPEIWRNGGKK